MLFNSIDFLIFFPIVSVVYYLIPKRGRYIWLLVTSYYFYMCWNPRYIFLIIFSTTVTYLSGILIEYCKDIENARKMLLCKKLCVGGSFFLNLIILFFFKYYNFVFSNISYMLSVVNIELHVPAFDIILPVGISFYVFQALSYTMDVYRNEIKAEKNFFKYALFVSFFPQLVAGPIERTKNLLKQINSPKHFSIRNVKDGLLLMAYGLFLKIVVADNIAIIVDEVFDNYLEMHGMILMGATILFAFQIYCDFEGYSQLAIGSAKILGFHINKNFESLYLALSVKEFWRRWHISLTSWFRDYLYIPLGGNRKGKIRKYLNIMIVFLASGLWHGAAWHYIVWGEVNGLYIVIQNATEKYRLKLYKILKINRETFAWRCFSIIITFFCIDISWLFFRATDLEQVTVIFKKIIKDFHITYLMSDAFLGMFNSTKNFMIISSSLMLIYKIDTMKYNNINVKETIYKQQFAVRYLIYFAIGMIILLWGAYGLGYEQTQFIYFQF